VDTRIAKTQEAIKAKEKLLSKKAFIEHARPEVVENERAKLSQLKEMLIKLQG